MKGRSINSLILTLVTLLYQVLSRFQNKYHVHTQLMVQFKQVNREKISTWQLLEYRTEILISKFLLELLRKP